MTKALLRKSFFHRDHFFLVFALGMLGSAGLLNLKLIKPKLVLSKQETALNVNKNVLGYLSAGNKRLLTDLLWVQTLLESDLEHYKQRDLNNWLFLRFTTIAHLDPMFYENYLYGGQYLSIVKDDPEGAAVIFEKGVAKFPDDYRLNFNLGFTYFFELGESGKGIKFIDKIKDYQQAPPYLKFIVSKLKLEIDHDYEVILAFLEEQLQYAADPQLRTRLLRDIYAVTAERDLNCLNLGKPDCKKTDFYGKSYILEGGKYRSEMKFEPYRIKRKK